MDALSADEVLGHDCTGSVVRTSHVYSHRVKFDSVSLESSITIRTELRPGDLGAITHLHGTLYARERGWDPTFEAYVAAGLAEFVLGYDPRHDRLWVAERDGRLVGSIAIQGREGDEAQLRWFLLAPECRGQGTGRRLLEEALEYCRSCGFRRVFLWTVSELTEAARLYVAAGFRCAEEQRHERWGAQVVEQRYEWTPGPVRDDAGQISDV